MLKNQAFYQAAATVIPLLLFAVVIQLKAFAKVTGANDYFYALTAITAAVVGETTALVVLYTNEASTFDASRVAVALGYLGGEILLVAGMQVIRQAADKVQFWGGISLLVLAMVSVLVKVFSVG